MASRHLVIGDQRLGPVRLECSSEEVWLTFDDGPGPQTLQIVETLNRAGCRATFFFIGEQLAAYSQLEELRMALVEGGHSVANHSYTHPSFLWQSDDSAFGQMKRTQELLCAHFPELTLPLFRPPFGYRKASTFRQATRLGLELIGWSVNSLDFLNSPPERLLERLKASVKPGSVVLFHDGREGRETTLSALPALLDWLKARGYQTYNPRA